MAVQLESLDAIARLSDSVIRILGGNPGKFTLQGTNTYLVGQGRNRILIDTGEGKPAWVESLQQVLEDEHATISHILLTHRHPDHVQGVSDALTLCPRALVYKHQPTDGQLGISDGAVLRTQGATLRAVHCPGHTTDHMAFILEEAAILFTGDNVIGQGTAVFEDLATYLHSLQLMLGLSAIQGYPGHGPVITDIKAKITEYIFHRAQREQQVLDVIEGGRASTAKDIVAIIYSDYPESLHAPAENGVEQILIKLRCEGKVK